MAGSRRRASSANGRPCRPEAHTASTADPATAPPFPEREGVAADAALASRRAAMAAAVAGRAFATDPPPREARLGGVRTLAFGAGSEARVTILHFHGGGYRLGCPEMLGPYAASLAVRTSAQVLCPSYRLAPENPVPAALNDAWHAARACRGRGRRLIVAGDSAGGGLAAALTGLLVAAGDPPDGLLLISPWLDLTVRAASYRANAATDPLFSRAAAAAGAEGYLRGLAPDDPRASPLFAAVAGFPPTFISVGTGEVLVDDARGFARRLGQAGVAAVLSERADMEHTAMVRDPAAPGAAETLAELVAFVDRILA